MNLFYKVVVNKFRSCLENLPNETLIEIFEYLDMNDIYHGFYDLNSRFESLLINFDIPFQIDLSKIPKYEFDVYNQNVFQKNKHRIKILRLSNPFTIDELFSPIRLMFHLTQLEKLILDKIHSKYLHNILKNLIYLPKLNSLILSPIDYISNPNLILMEIFCLKQLKSCRLTYKMKKNEIILPIDFEQSEASPIEYLIINGPFRCESFPKLFTYLPKLRHLSINYLLGSNQMNFSPIELKHLKYVSLNLHSIRFNQFQILIENFFRHIVVLRISTFNSFSHSNAEQWEELISTSLPNLRIFDIQNSYNCVMQNFLYACTSGHFRSRFWREKQWFFNDDSDDSSNSGRFYSTKPYR